VKRAARQAGPLLDAIPEQLEFVAAAKNDRMKERLIADFHGSGHDPPARINDLLRAEVGQSRCKKAAATLGGFQWTIYEDRRMCNCGGNGRELPKGLYS